MRKGNSCTLTCNRWITALLCATVLTLSAPVFGQEGTADELARRHFEAGAAYLHESDYENALREFQKAFELSQRPAILLNIATVHERVSKLDAAVSTLEQYLELDPQGEHADTVKVRIANLKKRRAEQQTEAEAAAGPASAPEQPAPTPATGPSGAVPTAAAPAQPLPPPEPEPEPNVPAYVLLGIGGVSAIAAGVTGYLADREWHDAQDACSPNCTNEELSTGRKMAWASTILTGAAVVGVGVGAALVLLGNREDDGPAASRGLPEVGLEVGRRGGAAHAAWRF
jgi:tetratricopeptide (TPR) repeat protein